VGGKGNGLGRAKVGFWEGKWGRGNRLEGEKTDFLNALVLLLLAFEFLAGGDEGLEGGLEGLVGCGEGLQGGGGGGGRGGHCGGVGMVERWMFGQWWWCIEVDGGGVGLSQGWAL